VTPEIALVLSILAGSIFFLVTEWVPMEVVALLVLGSLPLCGLITPGEALAGFSNPAVVTVWAVFILSGGLTRTGVGNLIGQRILLLAGKREAAIVIVIMISSGILSAFMNNVAVAALLLPVVMDIARSTGLAPSRLLMPLAFGSLLGGLTTQIGTPPNILVSEALRENGLRPFGLFDFTPVGVGIMIAGVAYVTLIGRRLLPLRNVAAESATAKKPQLNSDYRLGERTFVMRIPAGSELVGKTLAESRLGSVLGLNVIGITRQDRTILAPESAESLRQGDRLYVEGQIEKMIELQDWRHLTVEKEGIDVEKLFLKTLGFAEVRLSQKSQCIGRTLSEIQFQNRFGATVLAIRRSHQNLRASLQDQILEAGDYLLIQERKDKLTEFADHPDFEEFRWVTDADLTQTYHLHKQMLLLRVPQNSPLAGRSLKESRIGNVLGMRVLFIRGEDGSLQLPKKEERLQAGDCLVVEGRKEDLLILRALAELEIERRSLPDFQALESEQVGWIETVLSPHSNLAGKTLRQLNFREKYGLSVLAIWRQGQVHYADLRNMALNFGDALLLYGPRAKLQVLGREADFIVLTQSAQEIVRQEKMKLAAAIMVLVLLPVVLGWVPIYIAVVVGAALMVLGRCLTMEEAYRYIEWKAVFLIAGMFPLGTALDKTGAAAYLASGVVAVAGPFGPMAVLFGMVVLTFFATCFIPTAALVVLLSPIILQASTNMGMSPYPLMMAMAMAASASFTTPISHPANILVMGPGGYRFSDYLKVGGSLTLVVLLVIMLVLPIFWPLGP